MVVYDKKPKDFAQLVNAASQQSCTLPSRACRTALLTKQERRKGVLSLPKDPAAAEPSEGCGEAALERKVTLKQDGGKSPPKKASARCPHLGHACHHRSQPSRTCYFLCTSSLLHQTTPGPPNSSLNEYLNFTTATNHLDPRHTGKPPNRSETSFTTKTAKNHGRPRRQRATQSPRSPARRDRTTRAHHQRQAPDL